MSPDLPRRYLPGLFIVILLVLFIVAAGCTGTPAQTRTQAQAGTSAFETALANITNAPQYAHSSWGIIVVDPSTGQMLYGKNPDEMFVPASATRLFTAAAVLETLGPDYRFKTPVYVTPAANGSGSDVNLVLVASGDPNMGGRTLPDGTIAYMNSDHSESKGMLTPTDPLAGLDDLARQVKASNVTRVSDVVIDDRLFTNYQGEYMDLLSPIVINDNMVDVSVTPGAPNTTPSFVMRPETAAYRLDNRVTTGPAGSLTAIDTEENPAGTIVVYGTIAADAGTVNKTYPVTDPAAFARTLFIEALRRQGVDVTSAASGSNPAAKIPRRTVTAVRRRWQSSTSLPLSEDVKLTLKVSQNMHANYYVMLLALADNKTGYYDGMVKEGDVLRSLGLDTTALALGDGAGGDRVDRTSPRTAAQLLTLVSKRPYGDKFVKASRSSGSTGPPPTTAGPATRGAVTSMQRPAPVPGRITSTSRASCMQRASPDMSIRRAGNVSSLPSSSTMCPMTEGVTTDSVGTDLGSIAGLIYEYY